MYRAAKGAVGRARPNVSEDGYRFQPFSGHHSFPSGHTTDAFAIVTPWILYADSRLAWAAFALPAGTAVARLEEGRHFFTDVLAGAALGIATSAFLVRRHSAARALTAGPASETGDSSPRSASAVSTDVQIFPNGAKLSIRFR
jgi:membrane-associated phospholipid phosphatase